MTRGERRLDAWLWVVMVLAALPWAPVTAEAREPFACDPESQDCTPFYLDAITVHGLEHTDAEVILDELLFTDGEVVTRPEVEESIQRVRNTTLFRKVGYHLSPVPDGPREDMQAYKLSIVVDERWTTLPIFSFARGGGITSLTVGAYDKNFLGEFIGVGGQYERLGEADSVRGWIYDPRAFDMRLRIGMEAGSKNDTTTFYDSAGDVTGGYFVSRLSGGLHVTREWLWWFRTTFATTYVYDTFSYDYISEEAREAQQDEGLPDDSRALLFEGVASFGRIDRRNYLRDGLQFNVGVTHANQALLSTVDVTALRSDVAFFRTLPLNSTIGVRFGAGVADVTSPQFLFTSGGLSGVRGFSNDRFHGDHEAFANLEYRIPSFDYAWFVLQHIIFVDATSLTDDVTELPGLSGASAGFGLRIIVPKIHSFVIRVDYAFPLYGRLSTPLSFGGGQFL